MKSFIKSIGSLAVFSLLLTACQKDNPAPTPTIAGLSFFQASKDLDQINLNSGTQKINTTVFKYLDFLGYRNFSAGKHEITITKQGSATTITKVSMELKARVAYSAFVMGTTSAPAVLLVEDNLTPVTTKAKVRFVHLKADAKEIDVFINADKTALFTKAPYKSAQAFKEIDAADELKITLKETGKTEILAEFTKIKVEKGKIYTFVFSDPKAGDMSKMALITVTNR